jgi:hypothetical protein
VRNDEDSFRSPKRVQSGQVFPSVPSAYPERKKKVGKGIRQVMERLLAASMLESLGDNGMTGQQGRL